jgi:L-iditol 2-dehydrogenase
MLPKTQLSAYLLEPGKIDVREVPVPQPGHGQVLLRVDCALAGGTDRKAFIRGHPQIPMPGPFGHRYAGSVAAVGPHSIAFEVGQPVMGVHSAPCLTCRFCRSNRQNLCPDVMREKVLGAFSQYLCVPAPIARQNLFPRPEHVPAQHAALLEPFACVVHGLEMIDWRHVESVLILGLGVMGLVFAQLLPHYTKARAAGVARRQAALELARRWGLDPVWNVSQSPLKEQLPSAEQFDCVLECTGKLEGWMEAVERTAPGGQTLLFGGLPRGTIFPVDSYRLHYEDLRLIGSFHFSPNDVAKARKFILSGQNELDALVSDTLPLRELPEVMRRLEKGEGMQYAVDPWK